MLNWLASPLQALRAVEIRGLLSFRGFKSKKTTARVILNLVIGEMVETPIIW